MNTQKHKLNPKRKILSGVAMNLSGKVSDADLEYLKSVARKRSEDIQTVRLFDEKLNAETVLVFEYYWELKGFKLLHYCFRKFITAMARYMNLGDIVVNVILKGNELTGFPVHGA